MSQTKKLLSLLLAIMMVCCLSVSAMAEGNYSITINNSTTGHIYEAYQIFTGTLTPKLDASGNPVMGDDKEPAMILSDIKWGANSTGTAGDLVPVETLTGLTDANDAKDYVNFGSDPAVSANAPTNGQYVISNLEPGYYLVKDTDGSLSGGKDDAYTQYIVQVVGNVTATPKSDTPEVVKQVKDINDSDSNGLSDWKDSADYDLNDEIPFKLTATLANNVDAYTSYSVIFHDTLSDGLTYKDNSVSVKCNNNDVTNFFSVVHEGNKLTISCDNVKQTGFGAGNSAVITVEYTATLNERAIMGSKGNPNTVYLEYSNNPYEDQEGEPETGKTPPDKVVIFTYKVVVNKIDENKQPLTGAGFTLSKLNSETNTYDPVSEELIGNALTTFTWEHLDDGQYKLSETTTPPGYNTIEDIYFTITAGHSDGDEPTLDSLTGNVTDGVAEFSATIADENASLSTDVQNVPGTLLPETGGMGTTLLYVGGGVLVAVAAILLIFKKRMSVEK